MIKTKKIFFLIIKSVISLVALLTLVLLRLGLLRLGLLLDDGTIKEMKLSDIYMLTFKLWCVLIQL